MMHNAEEEQEAVTPFLSACWVDLTSRTRPLMRMQVVKLSKKIMHSVCCWVLRCSSLGVYFGSFVFQISCDVKKKRVHFVFTAAGDAVRLPTTTRIARILCDFGLL